MNRQGRTFPLLPLLGLLLAIAAAVALWMALRPSPLPAPSVTAPPPAVTAAPQPLPPPARIVPSFDVVRVGADGGLVIAGRSEAGAEVAILDGDRVIGTVKAGGNGQWVFAPDQPLAPGRHELQLRATAPDGYVAMADAPVIMVVPKQPGEVPLALKTLPDGGTVVLLGPQSQAGAGALAIETIDYADNRLSASGRTLPGAKLHLYLDGASLGEAEADALGHWRLPPHEVALPAGRHALRADQVGADGKVAARVEVPFTSGGEAKLDITVVEGNSLWRIARRHYGRGSAFTLIYQANKAAIRDPDLIYPGQVFHLPPK